MMIMMVTMSFGFITNSYKPSISFLLVASLGAAMVKEKNDDHDGDNEFWFHHQLLQAVNKLFARGFPRSSYGIVSLMGMAPAHNLFGVVDEHMNDGRQLKHDQDEAERHPTSGQRDTVESHLRVSTTTTER